MNKLILGLLLLFTASMVSATINLSANETYTFSYNLTNTTENTTIITPQSQDFYCSAPNACMSNATLSLSLNPGEIIMTNNASCSVTASCAPTSNQTCTVSTVLSSGQNYQNNDGNCRLTIACPTTSCNPETDTEILTNNITITSNGQVITFNFNGQLQQFPITNGSFSNYFQQTYSCPIYTVPAGNASAPENLTGKDLYDYCKTAQPYYLSWVDDQIKQNTKNQDAYNACVIKETEAENGCQARVDFAHTENLHCQDQLNASNNNLQTCYEEKAGAESTNGLYTIAIILLSVLVAMSVIGCVTGWWLYFKQRRKTKEVDE